MTPLAALFPLSLLLPIAFGFGVIIGSFLNVYIYRFHTGKSLSGHSHCLSCGRTLTWYELFPLLSYLFLRAKCRTCGSTIPVRYFIVEATTGILFAATLLISTVPVFVLLYWFLMAILVVIVVYDYNHYVIPDSLTIAALIGTLALLAVKLYSGYSYELALLDVGAALLGAGFFLLLWVISKGQWLGFGDVKLAVPLGLLVSANYVFSFIVMSFWIGAAISLALLAVTRFGQGKTKLRFMAVPLTMKSVVPFAPFLIAGALVILFTSLNVLTLFASFA